MIEKGTIVIVADRVGVVVRTGEELCKETGADLDDHSGIWFGSLDGGIPVVRTIPSEYIQDGPRPLFEH